MGTITGTLVANTNLAQKKIVTITAPIASASDDIVLTLADHGVRTIHAVIPVITGGMDADFQTIMPTWSDLTITLTSKQADGGAADEFTGTTVTLIIIAD